MRKQKGKTSSLIWMALGAGFAVVIYGCTPAEETTDQTLQTESPTISCDVYQSQFDNEVWPILQSECLACHEQNHVNGELVLLNQGDSNYLETNFKTFKQVAAKRDAIGASLMLTKPGNLNNDHGGGQNFTVDSGEYSLFENLITSLETCTTELEENTGLILESGYARLRKTTFALAGRSPTAAEIASIDAAGSDAAKQDLVYGNIIDRLMSEDFFYERLKTIFNDLLLLDAFPNTKSLGEFDLRNFVNQNYFDHVNLDQYYDTGTKSTIRMEAGYGLAQAPLELIAHVVRNNRPFSEILTADYLLVNPYSATILSANTGDPDFAFTYGDDPSFVDHRDFREARILASANVDNAEVVSGDLIPQAGIISSPTFLRRYQTTSTNRNRNRARYVYKYFLDIDIEGLASRDALDLNNEIGTYPTLEDPQCKVCHDTLDPVAGLFKNRLGTGRYRGDYLNWFSERYIPQMLPPGLGDGPDDQLPSTHSANALQWLANRIVNESGFARAVMKTLFKGLTGQDVPTNSALFNNLTADFINSGYNLKKSVGNIVSSDYFLAANVSPAFTAEDYIEYGMARLLTPEQLQQKLLTLFNGYDWQAPQSRKGLLDVNSFKLLYGGIDSVEIISRTTDPTAFIAGIQERIANQAACETVAADFKLTANRMLFPLVETDDTPDTVAGSDNIKQNLVYLHKHILGEELTVDDAEIARSYELFVGARNLTSGTGIPAACANGLTAADPVRVDVERTVRPWMAVIAYLMSDYKFLYE